MSDYPKATIIIEEGGNGKISYENTGFVDLVGFIDITLDAAAQFEIVGKTGIDLKIMILEDFLKKYKKDADSKTGNIVNGACDIKITR